MRSRALHLRALAAQRSLLLFGPRQSGKTTLLRAEFPGAPYYNLLESETYRDLARRPELIRQQLTGRERVVVIDEIQKLPVLLNEVQAMLDRNKKVRFVLTGSSARNLRNGGVNLLGGRAWVAHLYPFVSPELDFQGLDRRLQIGSLPAIYESESPQEELKAYVGAYLREEVRAEGLVRAIEAFSRFLDVAGLSNGNLVNFTETGSDAGVPPRTVREYFHLLEDTLLGTMVEPYRGTVRRKPVSTTKFYFFDIGVANHLNRRASVAPGSPEYGAALEHLVFLECQAYLSYRRLELPLTFWRSQSKMEVDFVIGDEMGIEVKASANVSEKHLSGLRALAEEVPRIRKLVVCLERKARRTEDGIEILPVEEFLRKLWGDALVRAAR